MDTLPTTFCKSIHGCHSYCAINVPSMDGHLACHLLSKYPWMPQLLCHPWTIHGWTPCLPPSVKVSMDATVTVPLMYHPWMDTLPTTFCQSIRGCHSYCAINVPSIHELKMHSFSMQSYEQLHGILTISAFVIYLYMAIVQQLLRT